MCSAPASLGQRAGEDCSPRIVSDFISDGHVGAKAEWCFRERYVDRGTQTKPCELSDLMLKLKNLSKLHLKASYSFTVVESSLLGLRSVQGELSRRDAAFMKEVQALQARGALKEFPSLRHLHEECQAIRDKIGPIEADYYVREDRWHDQFEDLSQAEEAVYKQYAPELYNSESSLSQDNWNSNRPDSWTHMTTRSRKDSRDEKTPVSAVESKLSSQSSPTRTSQVLAEHKNIQYRPPQEKRRDGDPEAARNFRLGVLDNQRFIKSLDSSQNFQQPLIDHDPDTMGADLGHSENELNLLSNEDYPQLLTQFTNNRDRINRWILHSLLTSHLDAVMLKD